MGTINKKLDLFRRSILFLIILMTIIFSLVNNYKSSAYLISDESELETNFSDQTARTKEYDDCTKLAHIDECFGLSKDFAVEKRSGKVYGYFACSSAGLVIADLTIADKTTPLSVLDFNESVAYKLKLHNKKLYLFVRISPSGVESLYVIDVKNPASPIVLSKYDLLSQCQTFTIQSDNLFAVCQNECVILDISNSLSIQELSNFNNNYGTVYDSLIIDSYWLLHTVNSTILFDIADLEAPAFHSEFSAGLALSPDLLHSENLLIYGNETELIFYNITDPTNPQFLTGFDAGRTIYHLALSNNLLFLSSNSKPAYLYDIANITGIELLTNISINYFTDAILEDSIVYFSHTEGVSIFSISQRDYSLEELGVFYTTKSVVEVQVIGKEMFVLTIGAGLEIYDITNSWKPVKIGQYFNRSEDCIYFYDMEIANNIVYITDSGHNMVAVDISDRTKPKQIAADYDPPNDLTGAVTLQVSGDYLFYYRKSLGFIDVDYTLIYNISNPVKPTVVYEDAGITFFKYTLDVEFLDNYLYRTTSDATIEVYDYNNLTNITLVSSETITINNESITDLNYIEIKGEYCLISSASYGVVMYSLEGTNLTQIGSYNVTDSSISGPVGSYELELDMDNMLLYLQTKSAVEIVDISNIQNPSVVGSFVDTEEITGFVDDWKTSNINNLASYNNILYVAAGEDGVMIIHYDNIPFNDDYYTLIVRTWIAVSIPIIFLGGLLVIGTIAGKR